MPPDRHTRGAQPTSMGLGHHFVSPKKARDPKKTQTLVHIPGVNSKHQRLLDQMAALMNPSPQVLTTETPSSDFTRAESQAPTDIDHTACHVDDALNVPKVDLGWRRLLPNKMANNLCNAWKVLIPSLVNPHLKYCARTHGHALPEVHPSSHSCAQRQFSIVCLFFDLLIHHGLFPTAPSQPRMAISTDLLAFYCALFECSCDAIHALASALKTHYARRDFQMTNPDGQLIQEPFRRGLGQAVQWFNILQIEVERQTEVALQICCEQVYEARGLQSQEKTGVTTPVQSSTTLVQGRCTSVLTQRCPACFGGILFGRPLSEGGDIHVATDGNFHHRHRRSAGDCPRFYDPTYFLPKAQVNNVGQHILSQHKHAPKIRTSLKAVMDSFDDTGIMALICRHDIPLFFANIDSPGEQQKYAVALIEHLFSLLLQEATVITLYDVGCVLSRSLSQYDILPGSVTSLLQFATMAMHAYGHEWACQLEFNPHMCIGLGLSDGEGTERLWSRFVKLIGIQRSSSRQRRLWLIDRQAGAIGLEMRADLGDWIKRRLKRGVNSQGAAVQEVLSNCSIEAQDLQEHFHTKINILPLTDAPARLKKELDVVLALQADLDASDRALQLTRTVVEKGSATEETLDALESLERSHDRLMNKVEALYSSLNVHDRFPELQGVDLNFVRTLLMARDLKINIRKRAIGSFFEWDKLDRAVGGANCTKHQQTRKAIAKRQPALMTAIRKFNSYCERLESIFDPSWGVPLPAPLPTKLADLRNDQTLMEDVWITPSVGDVPHWIEDTDVRDGIQALLKRERCREEQRRIGLEADNLCRWFGTELAALELTLHSPANHTYVFPLQQRWDHVLQLQTRWVTPLASSIRFNSSANMAVNLAITLSESAGPSQAVMYRLVPTSLSLADPSTEDDTDEHVASFEDVAEEAVLLDILPDNTASDDDDDEAVGKTEFRIIWELPEVSACLSIGTPLTRLRPAQDGFLHQVFDPRDQSLLAQPTARINDTCINSCAALLHSEILTSSHEQPCAILSTHDLPRIRYNASDNILWRNTSWTSFWERDVWILPIHRPSPVGHWVFCAIYISTKQLHFFDSLAERQPWKTDVKDIMNLIARLSSIAHQWHGSDRIDLRGWVARPLTLDPLQTNGYNCGLWVLATLAAVLRGAHRSGMCEEDMIAFRHYICTLVMRLPTA
ncbi:hypothetical protein F4604DRAFT_1880298 [Suillus subluteus]|nr:hypothetical protein F4604DRAFT_1880298 [Suillus subluteus]